MNLRGKQVLNMTLKKEWFDLIKSGEKKEEYREIKEYWLSRLLNENDEVIKFDYVVFTNGYAANSPKIVVEYKGLKCATGKKKWGGSDQKCIVIKLGKVVG